MLGQCLRAPTNGASAEPVATGGLPGADRVPVCPVPIRPVPVDPPLVEGCCVENCCVAGGPSCKESSRDGNSESTESSRKAVDSLAATVSLSTASVPCTPGARVLVGVGSRRNATSTRLWT